MRGPSPAAGSVRLVSALDLAPSEVAISPTDTPKRFVNALATGSGTPRIFPSLKPTTSTSTLGGIALAIASEGSIRLGTFEIQGNQEPPEHPEKRPQEADDQSFEDENPHDAPT